MLMPLLVQIILSNDDNGDVSTAENQHELNTQSSLPTSTANSEDATVAGHIKTDIDKIIDAKGVHKLRDLSLTRAVQSLSDYQLLSQVQELDKFRRSCPNLYQRVRALFFLYAIYRFHLPERRYLLESHGSLIEEEIGRGKEKYVRENIPGGALICPKGYAALLDRRFGEAIDHFLSSISTSLSTIAISAESNTTSGVVPCHKRNDDVHHRELDRDVNKSISDRSVSTHTITHITPPRTSLVSLLSHDRTGSNATTFYQYSSASVGNSFTTRAMSSLSGSSELEGEDILSFYSSANSNLNSERAGQPQRSQPIQISYDNSASTKDDSQQHQQHRNIMKFPSDSTCSALSKAYRSLAFQTLADQVKSSVRNHPGNEWMFEVINVKEHPRCWIIELFDGMTFNSETDVRNSDTSKLASEGPSLQERTPVRMDLSHSCWSDIFFLGMDFPEGARVINCSVDLAVHDSKNASYAAMDGNVCIRPTPPIECELRFTTNNPGTIRLTSVDLNCSVLLTHISQVFDFAADYLGLLKAGLVASGVVPLGLEKQNKKRDIPINELLVAMSPSTLTQSHTDDTQKGATSCKYGIELTTYVHNIPKGSRLAVSTNLLGSIISLLMRATNQTSSISGPLNESERRLVAARAILGEWLGGSGGGWQDSGGVWPGLKLIHGVRPKKGDPEYGISRGRLLPNHRLLSREEAPVSLFEALEKSLVLVHGGMAQNVGPVLEMVTEKYLLREEEEWLARHRSMEILDELRLAFQASDVKKIAGLVTENFLGPIRSIVPWATNLYTETLIHRVQERFGEKFWGFWMLGGMSGGGMGFIFDPMAKKDALILLGEIMLETKRKMEHSLPFAMDPVVFDYRVNEQGTVAEWSRNSIAKAEIKGNHSFEANTESSSLGQNLEELLTNQGFDMEEQEQIRSDLHNGTIGLAKNRLPLESLLTDVTAEDVIIADGVSIPSVARRRGLQELALGTVGVVTLAAGVGSRWTQGAGVVKAIHPFCCLGGKHRTFMEVHLAKNQRVSKEVGMPIPHVFTTSWMTDEPVSSYVETLDENLFDRPIYISKGRSIGLRMIPMVRDLKFLWREQSHQRLDEQAQKVRESLHEALINWAKTNGEGSDYRENVAKQCLCPVGHWFEVPNLLLNGTLAEMMKKRPQLKTLMVHNIDTVGVDVDPGILGKFLETGSTLAYEVVPRRIEDVGGGLCRVNGKPRLVEGLALPREGDELKFSYYNSMTTWVDIDRLLSTFELDRNDILRHSDKISNAVHKFSRRLPTYVTIKEVKKRWGKGQEDIHPVAQFEKLWGDMSALDDVECCFFVVSRKRGQQLKEPAQLDGWSRDGGAAYLDSICSWEK